MILLGVAPCTAMVFVWSRLCAGDANYTLVQVAINDLIMVFAFRADRRAPAWGEPGARALGHPADGCGAVCGGASGGRVAHPGAIDQRGRIERLEQRLKPLAIVGLIATVLLLFMVQAQAILSNPWRLC